MYLKMLLFSKKIKKIYIVYIKVRRVYIDCCDFDHKTKIISLQKRTKMWSRQIKSSEVEK